jgi:hypothetical protein
MFSTRLHAWFHTLILEGQYQIESPSVHQRQVTEYRRPALTLGGS